jgi:hypothetical protein
MTAYYPAQYNIFVIEAAHFCVLVYSKLQIFADRLYRNLKKNPDFKSYADYFESGFSRFFYPKVGNIEVIKDSQVFSRTSVENLIKDLPAPELMDFIIYSDKLESGQVNKIVCYSPPYNFLYQKCKFKFISLTIVFSENERYNLKLYSEKENYYIVNNRLNKYLFCYLIRKQFGVIKDEASVSYTAELFDQDANNVKLCENDEIVLEIEKYTVQQVCNQLGVEYVETHADAKDDVAPAIKEYISTDYE